MKRKIYISLLFLFFAASMNAQSWPRFFWEQVELADTTGSIAIAKPDGNGAWSDSLRFWQGKLRIGVDTAATLADVRSLGFNETGTANTLPLWATSSTLSDSWLSQGSGALSLADTRVMRFIGHTTAGRPTGLAGHFGFNTSTSKFEYHNGSGWFNLGDNFANTDLTLTGSRIHNLSTNSFRLDNNLLSGALTVMGATGYVGIGTTNPAPMPGYTQVALEIKNTVNNLPSLRLSNATRYGGFGLDNTWFDLSTTANGFRTSINATNITTHTVNGLGIKVNPTSFHDLYVKDHARVGFLEFRSSGALGSTNLGLRATSSTSSLEFFGPGVGSVSSFIFTSRLPFSVTNTVTRKLIDISSSISLEGAATLNLIGITPTYTSGATINNIYRGFYYAPDATLLVPSDQHYAFYNTSGDIYFGNTGYLRFPTGTTAQRPTGAISISRFNSDNSDFEGHNGAEWKRFAWYNASNLDVGNYSFNIDQTVGAGQDDYITSYNDTSGEIELRPSGLSTHAQLKETVLTSITPGVTYQKFKDLFGQNLSNFTATDSTLTYTGSEDVLVEINYTGGIFFDISGAGTYRVTVKPYVNGGSYTEAISDVQISADGSEDWIQPIAGTAWVTLSTNDVISLRYQGTTGLTASLNNLSLTVKAL